MHVWMKVFLVPAGGYGIGGIKESEAMECMVSLSRDMVRSRKSNMVKKIVFSLLKKW